jgi:hypothetical protein
MALSSATTAVRRGLFAALLWLPMLSQGADRAAAQRYYAGVQAPEDIAVLTPGKELLLAQMRAFGETRPSSFASLNLSDGSVHVLPVRSGKPIWGDGSCAAVDAAPALHGFDLFRDKDRKWRLVVINNGGRSTVERYRVTSTGTHTELVWEGCVSVPADKVLNDVAALPGGGFVASNMGDARHFGNSAGLDFLLSGATTGTLVEWRPGKPLRDLPGSAAAFPNGVAVSRDGRWIYMGAWTGRQVIKYDRQAARIVGTVTLDFMVDNLSWTKEGTLLAAGADSVQEIRHCIDSQARECGNPYTVAEIDPRALRVRTLHRGPAGEMAGTSVAVRDGRWLYVSGFATDRILALDTVPRP